MPDTPRPSPTRYSLTLDDVARQFEEAGLPRNSRSLQRYCAAGRLDCIKEETANASKKIFQVIITRLLM